MEILGVRVDNLSHEEILQKITEFLNEEKFHQIATINPEFILTATEDAEFKNILNSTELNVADGFGIQLAFWKKKESLKARIAGVDLLNDILEIASDNNLRVFLAANSTGLSTWTETRDAIHKTYPSLKIDGANVDKNNLGSGLQISGCEILLCNFGAPAQENFIDQLKRDKIRLAIGVGGSFDFLTGKIKRAPKLVRKIGFEWLWRFAQEPTYRFKRIIRAVIIFPLKVILHK